jgi:hypothetical protein
MLVQGKAAGRFKPKAEQRYVEDLNRAKTPAWAKRCRLSLKAAYSFRHTK